jgi:hypothetical protein
MKKERKETPFVDRVTRDYNFQILARDNENAYWYKFNVEIRYVAKGTQT